MEAGSDKELRERSKRARGPGVIEEGVKEGTEETEVTQSKRRTVMK